MDNVVQREWCESCGGSGHSSGCTCRGGVAFVVGCCKACAGEGMVAIKTKEETKKLWLPDDYV